MRTDGGRTLAAWGMGLALLVATIAFSTLLLSYFYLRVENPQWPPDGVDRPGCCWARRRRRRRHRAAAIAIGWARHHDRATARSPTARRSGSSLGGALTAARRAASRSPTWRSLDFSAQDHAYGSIFYVLAGAMIALALVGCRHRRRRARRRAAAASSRRRRHAAVINAHRYAVVLAALWVIGAATLYLTPLADVSDRR